MASLYPPTVSLKCKRLHADAQLPDSKTLTLHAYLKSEAGHATKLVLPLGIARVIPTGVELTPEPPYAIVLHTHVNLAMIGVNILNPVPNTAQELSVVLHNTGTQVQWIEHDDPLARMMLVPIAIPAVEEVT
jgi:dUTPase